MGDKRRHNGLPIPPTRALGLPGASEALIQERQESPEAGPNPPFPRLECSAWQMLGGPVPYRMGSGDGKHCKAALDQGLVRDPSLIDEVPQT